MDKSILDKLIKFGFVTNVNVDASMYKDVDDLIAKGLITVPGAKQKIYELVGNLNVETDVEETPVEITKNTTEPTIDELTTVVETPHVEPTTVTETPVEEEPVTVTETTETTETTKKTVKKTTKKTE